MLLTFNVQNQIIMRTDCEIPVAKSENYLHAQFSFSSEWTGTKTAIFNNGTPYSIQLDENNACLVPWEVITASGFSVSVFCGQRITANTAYVKVLPSGYIEGQTPQPPSPTVYDQLQDDIDELKTEKQDKLIAGDNITIENGVISSTGGGTTDYRELLNKPRQLYTPSSDTVNIAAINDGIYDVADAFTLTSDGQTVYVEKGAILAVKRNNNDVYALFVNSADESGVIKKTADGSTGFAFIDLLRYNFADFVTSSELTAEATARQNADNVLLQGKVDIVQGSANEGKILKVNAQGNLELSNLSATDKRWNFVSTLPTSNITANMLYFMLAAKMFPSVAQYKDATFPYVTVSFDDSRVDNKWRLLCTNTQQMFYWEDGNPWSVKYREYVLSENGKSWVLYKDETTDADWASFIGISHRSNITSTTFKYSNASWESQYGSYVRWQSSYNTADINGDYVDQSQINVYQQEAFEYVDNAWVSRGIFDFTKLFDKVTTDINGKLNSNQSSANAGKYMKVANDGSLTPDTIDLSSKVDVSAIKQVTGGSTTDVMSQNAVTAALAEKAEKNKVFTNITVPTSSWVEEQTPTFADFPYRADITCQGVTATDLVLIYYSDTDRTNTDLYDGGTRAANAVSIYAKQIPDSSVGIDYIIAEVIA